MTHGFQVVVVVVVVVDGLTLNEVLSCQRVILPLLQGQTLRHVNPIFPDLPQNGILMGERGPFLLGLDILKV